MSLPALRSCSRILSPTAGRHLSSIGQTLQMSSTSKVKEPKAPKVKERSSSAKANAESAAPQVVEKGDTYKAGEEFFSYNSYSFYDIENKMQPNRVPQPSSEKMKVFCEEKIRSNQDTTDETTIGDAIRHLLPDEHGKMIEWPNMDYDEESKNKTKADKPKSEGAQAEKAWNKKRIPL